MLKEIFASLTLSLCAVAVHAQSAPPGTPNYPMRKGRSEPCWQQAGLQKPVALQLASIQREAHSQLEGVCSSTSLTSQQKQQQVKQIHEQARQKMEALITTDQEKTLMECRQQRAPNHPGAARNARAGGGCGSWQGRGRSGAYRETSPSAETGAPPEPSESSQEN